MTDLIEEMKYINREEDLYGTCDKADSICKYLELDENKELLEKNNIIAIYGPWGSGKSCLMKNIESNLNKDKFKTVWFNTWKYEKDDNLAYSLFKYITKDKFIGNLKEKGSFLLKNAFGILASISSSVEFNILNLISFKPGEGIIESQKQQKMLNEYIEKNKCLWEKMDEFEEVFKKVTFDNKKLVVFLDDLDRCESENIISLISSIKLLLSVNPNIIFVIGIDRDAVTLALQNKYHNDYNKADEYLEKIFTINFEVPNMISNKNLIKYVQDITNLNSDDCNLIISFFKQIKFNNPRHIKKILRKYSGIKNYLKDNQINIDDVTVVIFIFYFIILANFKREEYLSLHLDEREKLYKNIILVRNRDTSETKRYPFLRYKKSIKVEYDENNKNELYSILIELSPSKICKSEIDIIGTIGGSACIVFAEWMTLFENSICTNFLMFFKNNIEKFDPFFKSNEFDVEKYKTILNKVDEIM